MDKRYQIFVSSTFVDLQEERREVMQTLLELNCIPAGMELFPASDDDAWTLIEEVIEQSDYYLVIVGGKYGSLDERGISYTEKEYDYALQIGKPIAPFLHGTPAKLTVDKIELDSKIRKKLNLFCKKLEKSHTCKYWNSAEDLGGKVAKSINLFIKRHPTPGWIKSDMASPDLIRDLHKAEIRIKELESEIESLKSDPPEGVEKLEQGEDIINLNTYISLSNKDERINRVASVSYNDIFFDIGPSIEDFTGEQGYRQKLNTSIKRILLRKGEFTQIKSLIVDNEDFQKLKYQFNALGLIIKIKNQWRGYSWKLSNYGEKLLYNKYLQTR